MGKKLILLFVGTALVILPASAQNAGDQAKKEIQLTRQIIQTERQAIVIQAMQLTSEENDSFWPLYRDWRAKVAGLGDRELKLITEFAENYDTLSDEQAGELINEWQKIDEQYLKMRKQYIKRFRKILPEKKVMRFFQLENKMDAVIDFELAGTIPLAE